MLMHDITTCMQGHGSCGLGLGPWDCVHFLLCYYCVPLLVCNVALWHMGLLHWQAQKKHPDYFLPPAHTRKRVRERERERGGGGGQQEKTGHMWSTGGLVPMCLGSSSKQVLFWGFWAYGVIEGGKYHRKIHMTYLSSRVWREHISADKCLNIHGIVLAK